MSKFDRVYEDLLFNLNEEVKYVDSVLVDYVRLLITALKHEEYLDGDINKTINRVMKQEGGVKTLAIGKEGVPPLEIKMSSPKKDKFKVEVIDALDETDRKVFESDLSTNCIEDVLAHIQSKKLKELGAEEAVEEVPPSTGGEAQPGAQTGSALPGMTPPLEGTFPQ